MNIKTPAFIPQQEFKEIFPLVLSSGTEILKQSNKLKRYSLSLREVFGLCIISAFKIILEPNEKWIFGTEPQLSDDGVVGTINEINEITYYEKVEQVYLPGCYLKRDDNKSMNDYILENIAKTKDKGSEYEKDTALFILSDIKSGNSSDTFEWQDFVTKFFTKYKFLHLYFLTLINHTFDSNEYYLLSFTNQKHRQYLNGEFKFKLKADGIFYFECIQEINILKRKDNTEIKQ